MRLAEAVVVAVSFLDAPEIRSIARSLGAYASLLDDPRDADQARVLATLLGELSTIIDADPVPEGTRAC